MSVSELIVEVILNAVKCVVSEDNGRKRPTRQTVGSLNEKLKIL